MKKNLLKLFKEVEELKLPTKVLLQSSIVTDNIDDKGLSEYEIKQLRDGKFPKSIWNIQNREEGLIKLFEQWLEERASPKIMIDSLIKALNSNFNNLGKTLAIIAYGEDLINDKLINNWGTSLRVASNKNGKILNEDLYDAIVFLWNKEVKLKGKYLENNYNSDPKSEDHITLSTLTAANEKTQLNGNIDIEVGQLRTQVSALKKELASRESDIDRIYIKIGKWLIDSLM